MSVVLVVDNADVAFLYALTVQLKNFEIWLIPADSVEKAHLMRKHIGRLDLLIINCNVPLVCPFAVVMARQVPGLKILGITSEGHQCGSCRKSLSALLRDRQPRTDDDIQQWMGAVQALVNWVGQPPARTT
jgi:hypothetical protein